MYPYHDALCHSLKLAAEVYETTTLVSEDLLDDNDVEAMVKAAQAFDKNIPKELRSHPFCEHVKLLLNVNIETHTKSDTWEVHEKLESTLVSFIEAAIKTEYADE